jgi:hypothetical protein
MTGTDVGTFSADFVHCLPETGYVVGLPKEYAERRYFDSDGIRRLPGHPGLLTHLFGKEDCSGLTLAVQGVGKSLKAVPPSQRRGRVPHRADVRREVAEKVAKSTALLWRIPMHRLCKCVCVLAERSMGGILTRRDPQAFVQDCLRRRQPTSWLHPKTPPAQR